MLRNDFNTHSGPTKLTNITHTFSDLKINPQAAEGTSSAFFLQIDFQAEKNLRVEKLNILYTKDRYNINNELYVNIINLSQRFIKCRCIY